MPIQQAFLDHQRQQETSERQQCSSGTLLTDLATFHLSNHRGTRMPFITEWFGMHRVLNKVAGNIHGCKFLRSVSQPALCSDNRLAEAFLAMHETGDEVADISKLKDILMRSATIHDARDFDKHTPSLRRRANTTTWDNTRGVLAEIVKTSDPEVTCTVHQTQQKPTTPGACMQQDICDDLNPEEQSAW